MSADEFTLGDVTFARLVSDEFRTDGKDESANAWAQLAARIEKVLVNEFVKFTRSDAALVQALHLAVLRHALVKGLSKERSAQLSRLGVLVVQAERGALAQLTGRAL